MEISIPRKGAQLKPHKCSMLVFLYTDLILQTPVWMFYMSKT